MSLATRKCSIAPSKTEPAAMQSQHSGILTGLAGSQWHLQKNSRPFTWALQRNLHSPPSTRLALKISLLKQTTLMNATSLIPEIHQMSWSLIQTMRTRSHRISDCSIIIRFENNRHHEQPQSDLIHTHHETVTSSDQRFEWRNCDVPVLSRAPEKDQIAKK